MTNATRSAILLIVPVVCKEVSFGDPMPLGWYFSISMSLYARRLILSNAYPPPPSYAHTPSNSSAYPRRGQPFRIFSFPVDKFDFCDILVLKLECGVEPLIFREFTFACPTFLFYHLFLDLLSQDTS